MAPMFMVRIRPWLNEWRFYRLEVWPDLFGGALLMRQWGRLGSEGQRRFAWFADAGQASERALALARSKRRRGYEHHSSG